MGVFIGWQSPDGVIIGGFGNNVDEALSECDKAGLPDGMAMAWSVTMGRADEYIGGERQPSSPADPDGVEADPSGEGDSPSDEAAERIAAFDAAVGNTPDAGPDTDGEADADAGREAAAEQGPPDGEGTGEDAALQCSICADVVTEARAEVSVDECGEIRCKTHTP